MNPFMKIETLCASAVERAFAVAFPSPVEPVQVARKLVAVFETSGGGRAGCRFIVAVSPSDFERLENDREYLERQWSSMLARLAERANRPQRAPEVRLARRDSLPRGTVDIATESLALPQRLSLRLRKGLPLGARLPLRGTLNIGRDPASDLALGDPRASRRHLRIEATGEGFRFFDPGSANGVFLNGKRCAEGQLEIGDVLVLGDSELVVEADAEE